MALTPLGPGQVRAQVHGATLTWRPGSYVFFAHAARVRTTRADVEELVAAAKTWFRARGRTDFTWWLGPHATPADIGELLQSHGAQPHSTATAMVADASPPPSTSSAEVEVVPVTTRAQFVAARQLLDSDGDGDPPDGPEAASDARWDEPWAGFQAAGREMSGYLAYLDGSPVAAGGLLLGESGMAMLAGGATLAAARGRGCYRALVSARWEAARAAGHPTLVVQASGFSEPILRRLGFRPGAAVTILRQDV